MATGDADPYDNEFRTFGFDPDYQVALMMFEEPMPILRGTNITDESTNNYFLRIIGGRRMVIYPKSVRVGDLITMNFHLQKLQKTPSVSLNLK